MFFKRKHTQQIEPLPAIDYASLLTRVITYTTDFIPTITSGEEHRTSYSIFNGSVTNFLKHETALQVYSMSIERLEQKIEHYAKENQRHSVESVLKNKSKPKYSKENRFNRAAARRTHTRLKETQDYGIQEHVGNIVVETVQYPDYPNDFYRIYEPIQYIQEKVTGNKNLVSMLSVISKEHEFLERLYMEVFGYNTLQEAIENERYLRVLLDSHSLHDIFLWYNRNLPPYYTAYMQLYRSFSSRLEYFVSVHDSYEASVAMEDRIREETFPVQRRLMRHIFDDPAILDNAAHAPLEWLMQTKDVSGLASIAENIFSEGI